MIHKLARIALLLGAGLLLAFGLARERHTVQRLDTGQITPLTGPQFVEGATVDSYMLKDSQIFDIYSLSGSRSTIKDCKT